MLLEDILSAYAQYLAVAHRGESADHWEQTYHSLVLQGKLRAAVWWIIERETGGVLQREESCTKTG